MSQNKNNAEGYSDPTAHAALNIIERELKIKKYRPLVYICSPFAGDIEYNTIKAREYSRFAVSKVAIPIAPHLLFPQFMDDNDNAQRTLAIFMGLVLMKKCSEVWCFGSKISEGMSIELEKAKKKGMVIKYFNDKCEEVNLNV